VEKERHAMHTVSGGPKATLWRTCLEGFPGLTRMSTSGVPADDALLSQILGCHPRDLATSKLEEVIGIYSAIVFQKRGCQSSNVLSPSHNLLIPVSSLLFCWQNILSFDLTFTA